MKVSSSAPARSSSATPLSSTPDGEPGPGSPYIGSVLARLRQVPNDLAPVTTSVARRGFEPLTLFLERNWWQKSDLPRTPTTETARSRQHRRAGRTKPRV